MLQGEPLEFNENIYYSIYTWLSQHKVEAGHFYTVEWRIDTHKTFERKVCVMLHS